MFETQIPKAHSPIMTVDTLVEKMQDCEAVYSGSFIFYCSNYEITSNLQEVMWAGNEKKQE